MTVAATARRRRRQFANGMKHLAKIGRPQHKNTSLAKKAKRLQQVIEKQKVMQMRKKS
jgi:hypothetical protein